MPIPTGGRVAATTLAVAVSIFGMTAAAVAYAQSGSGNHSARPAAGAPSSHDLGAKAHKPHGTPKGPDAKGPAAFGLCNAWTHNHTHHKATSKSVAFRNLAAAAGGQDKIAAYCATVHHPGQGDGRQHNDKTKPSTHSGIDR